MFGGKIGIPELLIIIMIWAAPLTLFGFLAVCQLQLFSIKRDVKRIADYLESTHRLRVG